MCVCVCVCVGVLFLISLPCPVCSFVLFLCVVLRCVLGVFCVLFLSVSVHVLSMSVCLGGLHLFCPQRRCSVTVLVLLSVCSAMLLCVELYHAVLLSFSYVLPVMYCVMLCYVTLG